MLMWNIFSILSSNQLFLRFLKTALFLQGCELCGMPWVKFRFKCLFSSHWLDLSFTKICLSSVETISVTNDHFPHQVMFTSLTQAHLKGSCSSGQHKSHWNYQLMQFWALQGLNFIFTFKYSSAVLAFNNCLISLIFGRPCSIIRQ